MRTSVGRWVAAAALGAALGCGGAGTEGGLDPTGGQLCLPDGTVCFVVPPGALADYETFRIAPTDDVPPAALSPGVDISPLRSERVTFLKPARVVFSLELVDTGQLPNDNLLRVYSREPDADWQPLAHPQVDRVRNEVSGDVTHLSPFVVLRADRLPDGGLPIEGDAGHREDSGVIVVPPVPDAGRPDAGRPDAGQPDAGRPDAGQPDAGRPDAGQPDAGQPDAGQPDAGRPDAGQPDAGQPDAGAPDAGEVDAGEPDAGEVDAGAPDAGDEAPDAGDEADAG